MGAVGRREILRTLARCYMSACRALLVLGAILGSSLVLGHGGGLDSNGCHTNRKTGDYHCHRPQASQATRSPAQGSGSSTSQSLLSAGLAPVPNQSTERQLILSAQHLLIALNHLTQPADGLLGRATQAAILEFQSQHNIDFDPKVSLALVVSLSEAVAKREKAARK
jgi:hypothetical protein